MQRNDVIWVLCRGEERQARQLLGSSRDCGYCQVSVFWTWKVEAAEAGQQRQNLVWKSFASAQHSSKTRHLACSQPAHWIYHFSLRLSESEVGFEFSGIQPNHSGFTVRNLNSSNFGHKVQGPHPCSLQFFTDYSWHLKVLHGFPTVPFRHVKVPAFSRGFTEKLQWVRHEKQ